MRMSDDGLLVRKDGTPVTVYLAGQMSGLREYNFGEFNRYAAILRQAGYTVINPAETAGEATHLPRWWYFRLDFAFIRNVDFVFVIPGWSNSRGATAEAIQATEMGKEIYALGRMGLPIGKVRVKSWHLDWDIEQVGGLEDAN